MNRKLALSVSAFLILGMSAGCDPVQPDDDTQSGNDELTMDAIDDCNANGKKQAVCHVPPGNPANAHVICISVNAVDKHTSKHGDWLAGAEDCTDGVDNDCDGFTDCDDRSCYLSDECNDERLER